MVILLAKFSMNDAFLCLRCADRPVGLVVLAWPEERGRLFRELRLGLMKARPVTNKGTTRKLSRRGIYQCACGAERQGIARSGL